jgi:Restriction endonuclease
VNQPNNNTVRYFRATLPNGQKVRIATSQTGVNASSSHLAAEGERLAALLNSKATESALVRFLEDVCPAIFPECAPNPQIVRPQESSEAGLDVVFVLKDHLGLGAVEIKHPSSPVESSMISATRQIQLMLQPAAGIPLPIKVAYVIAGRGPITRSAAAAARDVQDSTGIPIYLWSWDTVALRMGSSGEEQASDATTVVLVEVMNFARRLLGRLVEHPHLLNAIDDHHFEELVATLLSDLGLKDVELTPLRKDGGKDIVATHIDSDGNRSRFLIECKHWVSGKKVTMRWALRLMSVRRNDKADGAILLSSSGFGPRLLDQEVTLAVDKLYLRGTGALLRWIQLWERKYGSIITEPVPPEVLFELT